MRSRREAFAQWRRMIPLNQEKVRERQATAAKMSASSPMSAALQEQMVMRPVEKELTDFKAE